MSPTTLFPSRAGVIFDMDGLMMDTERVARIACQAAAKLGGYEMSDVLFESLIGRTSKDSTGLLRTAFGPGFDFQNYNLDANRLFEEYVAQHGVPLKDGVHEALADLFARKIPLGVATSTRNPNARRRLEQTGLMKYFSVLVTGDEIAHGKPAPDIYLEAIRRLEIDAATSFALEDSHAGVRSAHAAGLQVIMVPDLLKPEPEIVALTKRVAKSLHEAREFLAG
jgi:HAD superfamily hydrolase (TIGR01509 family)